MDIKILFLDMQNVLSKMAADIAGKIAAPGFVFTSAGIEPLPLDDKLRKVFETCGIISQKLEYVEDFTAARFDLIIVIGSLTEKYIPVMSGLPPLIKWDIVEPDTFDCSSFKLIFDAINSRVHDLFNHGFIKTLIRQKTYLENILDSLHEGVIAHDLDRNVFLFSRGAEIITGTARDKILGRDCHEIFSPRICGDHCEFCDLGVKKRTLSQSTFQTLFTGDINHRKELDVTRIPLKDEGGCVIGAVVTFSDTTKFRELEKKFGSPASFYGIIGQDSTIQMIFDLIRDLACSDFPVIITGESGTGKELVAAAIHSESNRRDRLFVPVNCGALPEGTLESELFGHVRGAFTGAFRDKKGRFELADKGTLFLDEIAELSQQMQVKLLRVLQEGIIEPVGSETNRKVDVRIICATNRNLKEMVARGTFREDLFYRLAVVPIEIPPLRERRNDILLLADHFLSFTSSKLSRSGMAFSDDTVPFLMNYDWPGNVRQLQNSIQFAMIRCKGNLILPVHLPPEILLEQCPDVPVQVTGKVGRKPKLTYDLIEGALIKAGGNKSKAAKILGVGRATLYNYISSHSEEFTALDYS